MHFSLINGEIELTKNGLHLDSPIREIPLYQGSDSHSLSRKETNIILLEIQKLLSRNKFIVGSIPKASELL